METFVLKSFIPEIFLSFAILFQLIFNAKMINNLKYNFPIIDKEVFSQTAFILFCLLLLFINLKIEGFFSNFLFINDESTRCVKILIIFVCLLALNIVLETFALQKINLAEFFTVFLLALLASLLLLCAGDLLSFYLTIEMQSLCFYILANIKRDSSFATEAGLKYFISGAFMSGVFLFGCSLIYGVLGTLNLNFINLLLAFPFNSTDLEFCFVLQLGILCVTATLLFKVACAPFHFWAADVYDGAPLCSTIIFSLLPKLSLFLFFTRWIRSINIFFYNFDYILLSVGLFSAFLGTFYALSQKRLKRLIIYSSIAQIGFVVSGLSLNSLDGYTSVFFFLIIYLMTALLIWSHISLFYVFQDRAQIFFNKRVTPLFLSSLSNTFQLNSLWAFSFVIIFFSIGGIPPLTGFLSKAFILLEIVNFGQVVPAALLIIISSISAFYYIRMVKIMFFEPAKSKKSPEKFQIVFNSPNLGFIYLIISCLLFLICFLFFYPTSLLLLCQYIVLNISNF